MIEFRHISPGGGGVANVDTLFLIKYRYDEAGNRIRKMQWKYTGMEIQPVFAEDSPYWDLVFNEFYVRDVSGKEIAIYQGTTLDQWNVWGLDNVGKINSGGSSYFYLKDHLGSVRVIVDVNNTVISAQDYDCWGYIMQNRSYTSYKSKYKFTNKERDAESNYDYFGARYYDSRIGNWTSIDPLFESVISESPYAYVSRNPLNYFDNNGKIKLPAELAEKYPKLTSFLQNELPKAIENKKTMDALIMWTYNLSSEEIKKDFQWDSGPTLDVVEMSNWGSFNANDPNKIKIQESTVNYFEKSSGDVQDVLSFFIQVVIMHEYTHYSANKAGVSFYYHEGDRKYLPDEEGWRFEEAAYGQQIGGPDVAAKYMNKQNKKRGVAKRYPTNIEEDLRKNK